MEAVVQLSLNHLDLPENLGIEETASHPSSAALDAMRLGDDQFLTWKTTTALLLLKTTLST
jgi:hypothetical protein